MQTPIIKFYLGNPDNKNRTLHEVLGWTDTQWDDCHNHIQWVFPLHEKSLHSIDTPVLTEDDIDFLRNSTKAQENMKLCIDRFRVFIANHKNWIQNGNHNLLRITRAIRSLRLFGLDKEATEFHKEMVSLARSHMVANDTIAYWDMALNDDLNKSMTRRFLHRKEIKL